MKNGSRPEEAYVHEGLKEIDAEFVAGRLKYVFMLIAELIPYRDLLVEAGEESAERANKVVGGAVVWTAMGLDYREAEFENKLRLKRTKAVLNLVDTLVETEKQRKEFREEQKIRAENRAFFSKMLGGF